MVNNSIKKYGIWKDYQLKLDNNLLTSINLSYALSKFWIDRLKNINKNQFILIQFKVKLVTGIIRSISHVQTVKKNDYETLLESFNLFWEIRSDEYHLTSIDSIIFTYKIIPLNSEIKQSKISKHPSINLENKPNFRFNGYNLPCTMDFTSWGEYIIKNDYNKAIVYKLNSKAEYHISLYNNYQIVELKLKNKTHIKFIDTIRDVSDLSSFTRTINNQEYIFENGKLIVKKIKRLTSFMSKIKSTIFRSNKFITMDLETRTIKGVMTPYCVSIYDGTTPISFYLSDYLNSDEMLQESVSYLMKRKYHQYKVYLHNFSHFDSIFLIRILSSLTDKIKPIIRDGRIIDLKFSFGSNNYILYFRDSYLLLPSSLKKLANNFNVESKGTFPYLFVNNPKLKIDYIGKIPEFNSFTNITIEEYNNYCLSFKNNNWDLRKETIKYCEQDVRTLYQIIDKFSFKIFNLFRIDILKYPTLSSLAFAIYRQNFIGNAKIPLINGEMFHFIKKGYTGGAVDVFKPYGEEIYRYDVNSLYPFVMKTFPMPVGIPTFFEGDISLIENKPFGIFEVEVTAPNNLNIPLLQVRTKTIKGIRTLSPIGNWTGTYLSEEIYNSMKYGYTFKILRGYLFEKGYIFTDYVDFLYNLKVNSDKNSPDYIISKLLLNSLYGRLGMNPEMENHSIVTNDQALSFHKKYDISNVLDLQNGKELISYFNNINKESNNKLNISIPISAAITAYARIHMSQFKTMKNTTLFYTDTDSIDIDKPLDPKFIGSELGKMKLEHIFKKVIFLAPKVYGGVTDTYEYVKVKGLKNNPITFDQLSVLLIKDKKLEIVQDKWYRNISQGNITIKNEIYTLMITDNKRKLIYNNNNRFIDTTPLIINNDSIINN